MRALLQRVSEAEVRVGGVIAGQIGVGLVVLLGIGKEDTEIVGDALARRITDAGALAPATAAIVLK